MVMVKISFSNPWFLLWLLIVILVFILINSFGVFEYINNQDIKNYNTWMINEGINYEEAYRLNSFQEVHLTSEDKNKYFVENDVLFIEFGFKNEEYHLIDFSLSQIGKNEEILEKDIRPCSETMNICQGRIRLKLETNKIEIIPEISKNNSNEQKKPVVMNIYTDVIKEKEADEKRRIEFLFFGSLISLVLFATAGFVNQLRQIWNDKK